MDPFLPPYTPTELPPPVYGLSLSIPTPSYPLPTTFTIGPNRLSEPLVTPEQIKAHLKLLRAFGELKLDVERSSWAGEKGGRGDTLGWAWFVDLAVHRFEKWITTLPVKRISDTTIFVESHIPPLDVLIVWHAYLLHPTKYARDRRANNTIDRLPRIYNNLIDIVKYIGDPGTSTPTKERAISWRKSTNTPFDPIQSASEILPARMNTHPIDEKKSQEKCEDPARNSLLTQIAEGSSPYRPFSFELVGAVFRQSTFTTKMHDIGWTDPSFLESTRGNVVLRYTIVRYHAFLDIFSSHRHESLIPTLDISLAWHTHQTYDDQYAWDCERWMVSGKEQFKWDWTERRFEL
ncbi:hypothetical protein JAAARDRAFT_51991 [Jaapia argillacea MUCL 33604]|uniref:Uncharacterized protein n=1 Tax=Jaapia argillacea MUCL 33604 TaxID=933084 RepID=A0A067QAH3_9AGAM|nr:hypothetical protein JAAARDRAFT_51991 [Jaapia argillacea MUCL 33604]